MLRHPDDDPGKGAALLPGFLSPRLRNISGVALVDAQIGGHICRIFHTKLRSGSYEEVPHGFLIAIDWQLVWILRGAGIRIALDLGLAHRIEAPLYKPGVLVAVTVCGDSQLLNCGTNVPMDVIDRGASRFLVEGSIKPTA